MAEHDPIPQEQDAQGSPNDEPAGEPAGESSDESADQPRDAIPEPTPDESSATTDTPGQPETPELEDGLAEALAMAQEAVSEIQNEAESTGDPAPGLDDIDASGMTEDEINAAMAEALGASGVPLDLPTLDDETTESMPEGLELLCDVNLDVKIELGRTRMFVEDVLRLTEGAVVELDKLAGDPVDVLVNGRLIAKGEVLVLNDNFCVRINEIISTDGLEATRASA